MGTSPYLSHAETPIVLIGHSMGGLVIKKAYMLATQDAAYQTLAKRFHTIYFLANPHRGSDSAKLLNTILQVAYSSKAYVADLKRNSEALRIINDGFRHCAGNIDLWSFYETQELSIGGVLKGLIVDPDSATLGYREEKQIPMTANHRSICKFDGKTDPNYLLLCNSLVTTVNGISKIVIKSKEKLLRSQVQDLAKFLGVSEMMEDDLIRAEDARMSGTCHWFSTKETYLKWKNFDSNAPSILWVSGQPAAGKSVLAGGAGSGTIHIYEFDTLRLLYKVRSSDFYIKQLVFSKNSLHFADIRGSQCNIWEPAIMLRNMVADDSSEGSNKSIIDAVMLNPKVKISSMLLQPGGEVVFCGKGDGSVCLYDLKTGVPRPIRSFVLIGATD